MWEQCERVMHASAGVPWSMWTKPCFKGLCCAGDLVEQMVDCDGVATNIFKFQDVLARRLPVAVHLSIHKK